MVSDQPKLGIGFMLRCPASPAGSRTSYSTPRRGPSINPFSRFLHSGNRVMIDLPIGLTVDGNKRSRAALFKSSTLPLESMAMMAHGMVFNRESRNVDGIVF